jgi:hypothetical protein
LGGFGIRHRHSLLLGSLYLEDRKARLAKETKDIDEATRCLGAAESNSAARKNEATMGTEKPSFHGRGLRIMEDNEGHTFDSM